MSIPDYMTRDPRSKKKKSKRQERRVAKKTDGRVQRGSGSQTFHKGDVRSVEMLVECKRTDKHSLSIKKEWLRKLWREAVGYAKVPALSIEFSSMDLESTNIFLEPHEIIERDWIMVPASFLRQLIEISRERLSDGSE
jgi:Holliday junction resolvase